MHLYQLEDTKMDQDFLAGAAVRVRAVTKEGERPVNPGDPILVLLSNGKKYKGKVVTFESVRLNDYAIGELVISRVR